MRTVTEFFDLTNIDHLKAYATLEKTGAWPEWFYEQIKDLDFQHGMWVVGIAHKIANQYVREKIGGYK